MRTLEDVDLRQEQFEHEFEGVVGDLRQQIEEVAKRLEAMTQVVRALQQPPQLE